MHSKCLLRLPCILFSLLILFQIHAEPDTLEGTTSYEHTLVPLQEQLNNQVQRLTFYVQQIAQKIANNAVVVNNKPAIQKKITQTLRLIEELEQIAHLTYKQKRLEHIIAIHMQITRTILDALQNEFCIFHVVEHPLESYLDQPGTPQSSIEQLKSLLKENESSLEDIERKIRIFGQSTINKITRSIEHTIKKTYVDKVIMRSWPYMLLGHWWLLHTQPEVIEKLNHQLGDYKKNLHQALHYLFGRFTLEPSAPIETAAAHGFESLFGGLIKCKTDTLLTLGIGGIVLPPIRRDMLEINSNILRYARKGYAKLKGIQPPSDPVRNPKGNFSKLIGAESAKEQATTAVAYLSDPDAFLTLGQKVPRGYILFGPRYSGKRTLSDAIAGEVTKHLKANSSGEYKYPDICKVYEIPGRELLTQSLNSLFGKIPSTIPCVIIITNIECLPMEDQSFVGGIIKALSSHFKNKKESIVIATTSNIQGVNPSLMANGLLSEKIYVGYPNLEDRKQLIEKKLKENGLAPEQFDLEALGLATEQQSFQEINRMLERFFSYANARRQPISSELFLEIIDREIYHINNHQTLYPEEIRILSVHYAGKALAHILKNPQAQLTKVTILPVIDDEGQKFGKCFSHDQGLLETVNYIDLKKECAIELAGEVAQNLILGDDASPFPNEKKQAFKHAHDIILQGIDEELLSKHTRDTLRDSIQELLVALTNEMHTLLETHREALLKIAQALEKKQTLTVKEIRELIEN